MDSLLEKHGRRITCPEPRATEMKSFEEEYRKIYKKCLGAGKPGATLQTVNEYEFRMLRDGWPGESEASLSVHVKGPEHYVALSNAEVRALKKLRMLLTEAKNPQASSRTLARTQISMTNIEEEMEGFRDAYAERGLKLEAEAMGDEAKAKVGRADGVNANLAKMNLDETSQIVAKEDGNSETFTPSDTKKPSLSSLFSKPTAAEKTAEATTDTFENPLIHPVVECSSTSGHKARAVKARVGTNESSPKIKADAEESGGWEVLSEDDEWDVIDKKELWIKTKHGHIKMA